MYPPTLGLTSAQTRSPATAVASRAYSELILGFEILPKLSRPPRQVFAILGASLTSIAAFSLAAILLHYEGPHQPQDPSRTQTNGATAIAQGQAFIENVIAFDLNRRFLPPSSATSGEAHRWGIGLLQMASLDQMAMGIGSFLVAIAAAALQKEHFLKRHDDGPSQVAGCDSPQQDGARAKQASDVEASIWGRLTSVFKQTVSSWPAVFGQTKQAAGDEASWSNVSTIKPAIMLLFLAPLYALLSTATMLALSNLVVFPNGPAASSAPPQIALVPVLAVRALCTIVSLVVPRLSLSFPLVATLALASASWILPLSSIASTSTIDVAVVCGYAAFSLAGKGLARQVTRELLTKSALIHTRDRRGGSPTVAASFTEGAQCLLASALLVAFSTSSPNGTTSVLNEILPVLGFLVFATVAYALSEYASASASIALHHRHDATISLDPTVHSPFSLTIVPPAATDLLRDACAVLAARIAFGISDVSPMMLKVAYFGACGTAVYALARARSTAEDGSMYSNGKLTDGNKSTTSVGSYKSVLVLAALSLSFVLIVSPTNPLSIHPSAPTSPTVAANWASASPSASRRKWSAWHPATPLNYDLTLQVNPSLPAPSTVGSKAAKVFAVTADSATASINDHMRISATLPPLSTWPRRKWDRQPIPRHANFSLRHHVRFGATGALAALQRYIVMHNTFADPQAHPDVHYRVYWSEWDDPRGLHGVKSFFVQAYKDATGMRYPVILSGDWRVMWFSMLVHMYETSPADVQWFALGNEGTVWFPRQLQALVTSLDIDPMNTYVYMGEISESKKRQRVHGVMAYANGGVLVSRALAALVHKHHAWCFAQVSGPNMFGDDMLKACLDAIAVKEGVRNVPLTRVPMFNPLELIGQLGRTSGRQYLSARLSRTPPVTLNDLEFMQPLFSSGVLTRMLAVHDLWHLVEQMPRALMFRRFFVHIRGGDVGREATAVITFGLHVRLYERIIADVDHAVDFDGSISKDAEFWGAEWLTENAAVSATNPWSWPRNETSITDFWIHEYDETGGGLMVYLDDSSHARFGIRATCGNGPVGRNVLTLCSLPTVVDGWVQ